MKKNKICDNPLNPCYPRSIIKGIDIKLNVKPAYLHLIHQHEYEGPCRTGPSEQLTTEFDIKIGKEKFENFKKDLNTTCQST